MKIWTLMENTSQCDCLTTEHGLSLYIEAGEYKILFDAGQSGAFADNAEKLGVNLANIDFAILSHGHYDHGDGFKRFLERNDTAPIYVSRHALEPHYNASGKYIGLEESLGKSRRLIFVDGERNLTENLSLHTCSFPPADTSGLQVQEDGVLQPEDFRHEQYLLAEEKGKRILFSGCSHKGIVALAQHFRPDILIGGFHFMKLEDEPALTKAADALLACPAVYYTGHCTGQKQYALLKTILKDRLHYLSTGSMLEL